MNLPNFLSFLRIFSVPVFIWLVVRGHGEGALWLFLLSAATDGLDGYVAKRFNKVTQLGKFLDPLADKLLLVGAFVTLTLVGAMPLWVTLLVVTRDVIIIGGAILYEVVTRALTMEPLWSSKVNTLAQITLVGLVLAREAYGWFGGLVVPFVGLVVVTTLFSGFGYIIEWSRRAGVQENDHGA